MSNKGSKTRVERRRKTALANLEKGKSPKKEYTAQQINILKIKLGFSKAV